MGWKAAGGPQGQAAPKGALRRSQTAGFGLRPNRPAGRFQPSAQILVKGVGRVPGPARGWGRSMQGQAKRGRAAAPGKSNAKWRACSLLGLGLLQGGGAPEGRFGSAEAGGFCRRGRPADGLPFGRPGRAEIQRKYRVTSAPGPADGRWLHGFAAPVRGKCGCGGWPQQNPPGVRQIQAHPRRQSAPARPR